MRESLFPGVKVILRETFADVAEGTTGTMVAHTANELVVEVEFGLDVVAIELKALEMLESWWDSNSIYE
jgi:hypothetical protein